MIDLFSKFNSIIAEREALAHTGVRDPFSIVMDQIKSPTVAVIKGKETILVGTYNYMGMTFDPDVIQAGKDALDRCCRRFLVNAFFLQPVFDQATDLGVSGFGHGSGPRAIRARTLVPPPPPPKGWPAKIRSSPP